MKTSQPIKTVTMIHRFSIAALSAGLALALLVMFFPSPQPKMLSNQMWRAELLASTFLFFAFLSSYFSGRSSIIGLRGLGDRMLKGLVFAVIAFIFWSGLSAIWSFSAFSAGHHTAVWAIYLLIFLFTAKQLEGGFRLVSITFLLTASIIGVLALIDHATVPDFKMLEGVLRGRYGRYAEMLATMLPVIWAVTVYSRRSDRQLIAFGGAVLGWIAVMLSLSKGAFIAGAAGILIFFVGGVLFSGRAFRRRILVSAGIWLTVTIVFQTAFAFLTATPATVDYISGKADATRETSTARIFMWNVGRAMIAGHPLIGVGADNFGVKFNEARARYRLSHPDEPKDEINSDNLIERAHNEAIQITAELGLIGLAIVVAAFAFASAAFWGAFRRKRFRPSPMFWASAGGLAAFFISSMVSSFSFRLAQNGIVFFIVMAAAANEIRKTHHLTSKEGEEDRPGHGVTLALLAVTGALAGVFFLKAWAEYCVWAADGESDRVAAAALYQKALRLDPDYRAAYLRNSGRSFGEKDYQAAAADLRKAIDGGMGVVLTYSSLADCYRRSGDISAAKSVYLESLSIFPRSTYLRVRYALLLREAGEGPASEAQIDAARRIDPRQAEGWLRIIEDGSVAAFLAAKEDSSIAAPAELKPEAAVYEYLDKTPGSDGQGF